MSAEALRAPAGSLPGSSRRAAWAWYDDEVIGSTLQIGFIPSLSRHNPIDAPMVADEDDHRWNRRASSA
ncbi:hypothetical protein FV242_29450 [Methylobacterium sp. WL64]|uniref:hypothetical protein n=1 Tax=Methylobacterium sp. WL64 TaxID=2603894 RepID=UPI0011C95DDE|nr:hypothetical protein [Methylobacterium sp. WL64]TXM98194.1 hypothetical protein FV242_29450 [Methylobacterium sp. WL64]